MMTTTALFSNRHTQKFGDTPFADYTFDQWLYVICNTWVDMNESQASSQDVVVLVWLYFDNGAAFDEALQMYTQYGCGSVLSKNVSTAERQRDIDNIFAIGLFASARKLDQSVIEYVNMFKLYACLSQTSSTHADVGRWISQNVAISVIFSDLVFIRTPSVLDACRLPGVLELVIQADPSFAELESAYSALIRYVDPTVGQHSYVFQARIVSMKRWLEEAMLTKLPRMPRK